MKLSFKIVSLVLVMSLTCSPLVLAEVRTITCNYCGNYVASTSRICPTCGKNPHSFTGSSLGDLFLLLLMGAALSSDNHHNNNSNSSSYQNSNQIPNHDFTLTGKIGKNNTIHGYININGNQISGNYGYKCNYGCTVNGYTYENGSMRATEVEDKSGKTTGTYQGKVISNNKIKGTFYSRKYRKNIPFTWYLR